MTHNSVLSPPADPREAGPKPPYRAEIETKQPGTEDQLLSPADFGEESYEGFGRLKDRVAIITGGDSGIGRAVALAYAREGADVVISYAGGEEEKDADRSADAVRKAGRRVLKIAGDIGNEKHCEAIVDRTIAEFGKLDILVNNAAYQMSYNDIDEITAQDWDQHFRVNIFAMFCLCRGAMKVMKPGAVIINTGSIQGHDPTGKLLAYATTKGAILNFTKGLAELAIEKGIRVNAVAPGPVWTPLIPSTMPKEKVENFGKDTAFKRAAQPAELAPAFVFLAINDARYMTGEIVGVTGGRTPL